MKYRGPDFLFRPPEQQRLDGIIAHQTVEQAGHLLRLQDEGPLNVRQLAGVLFVLTTISKVSTNVLGTARSGSLSMGYGILR
jgi:hypothetical protein